MPGPQQVLGELSPSCPPPGFSPWSQDLGVPPRGGACRGGGAWLRITEVLWAWHVPMALLGGSQGSSIAQTTHTQWHGFSTLSWGDSLASGQLGGGGRTSSSEAWGPPPGPRLLHHCFPKVGAQTDHVSELSTLVNVLPLCASSQGPDGVLGFPAGRGRLGQGHRYPHQAVKGTAQC